MLNSEIPTTKDDKNYCCTSATRQPCLYKCMLCADLSLL